MQVDEPQAVLVEPLPYLLDLPPGVEEVGVPVVAPVDVREAGLGDAPRTVLEEFAKIKSGDVVLPARSRNDRVNKTIRLRCVTTPDEAQKVLLNRLGLSLPQRLRRIDEVIQM